MKRINKTFLVSIISGCVAAILAAIYLYLRGLEVAGGGGVIDVVVAASDVPAQSIVEARHVRSKKMPRAFVEPTAIEKVDDVVGKLTAVPIKSGEQFTGTRLLFAGVDGGLSSKVVDGKRAVSISIEEADGVAGLIQPGDFVDVLFSFESSISDSPERYTRLLFQDVEVLAIDTRLYTPRNPSRVPVIERKGNNFFGPSPDITTVRGKGRVVTLLLGLLDAQKLINAGRNGEITLALRSISDHFAYTGEESVELEDVAGRAVGAGKKYREYRGR